MRGTYSNSCKNVRNVQGDHGGLTLWLWLAPLSAQFCLVRLQFIRDGMELNHKSQLNLVSNHHRHPVQGGPSGRGIMFVDIKLKV